MRRRLLVTMCIFIAVNTFSQITVTDANLVDVGDVIYQSYDDMPSSTISVGGSGINQIWDFSLLQSSINDTLFFVDPALTAFDSLYSNVNLSMIRSGSISYFNKTSSGLYLYGLSDTVFNNPVTFYPLPLTYNLNFTDGPVLAIDTVLTNPTLLSFIDSATVSTITNGLADKVDTAVILTSYISDFMIDASGTLTIPIGSFDVLRLKTIKHIVTDLNIYCSNSLTQSGSWVYNLPLSSIPLLSNFSNNQVEYKYEWLTNDASVGFLLVEAVVDSLDNIVGGVSFQDLPFQTEVNTLLQNSFKVYPVPTTYRLTIESKENISADLILRDVNGKLILEDQFKSSTTLSLEGFSKGVYYLTLTTKDGQLTKKVILD